MGKVLVILIIIWLVVLAVCIQRAAYWSGVVEDLNIEFASREPKDRVMTSEDVLARNEADRMAGMWTAGAFLWGAIGLIVLIWVWRWEEGREVDVHDPGSPK